ncbi:ATP-binding protein, partial [Streptomyces sp. YGL11-2]|uniref:ATP-binding protein n=1 Tax=Streptomyces sp. YGL11-2 TaxID=3414028 RepID=UPI003CFBBCB7
MRYAEALGKVVGWLEEPRRKGLVLHVVGAPGVGKSQLLADVQQRFPTAIAVDCRGRTADEVAEAVLDGLGIDATRAHRPDRLSEALAQHRGDSVVLLTNAQWAGPLFSCREPFRVGVRLAWMLGVDGGDRVRVVVESDTAHLRVTTHRDNDVLLESDAPSGEVPEAAIGRLLDTHPALAALAAAETRQISLSVWALLSRTLGTHATPDELSALLSTLPDDVVASHPTASPHDTLVSFRTDGLKHLARTARLSTPAQQRALAAELLTHITTRPPSGPVHAYAAQALALHAALSGTELPALLTSAPALAHCTRYSVLQALAHHFPDGVPQGGIAADIHYLETEGIAPEDQGEWLSWLHWAATNRGDTAWAAALADSGITLPWRTAWSHYRPYGVFGPFPGETGRVDHLFPGALAGTGAVAGQHLLPVFRDGDYVLPEGDDQAVERVWNLADGTELAPSAVVDICYGLEGDVESVEGRTRFESTADAALDLDDRTPLRVPYSITSSCATDGDRWVLAGRGGLFALDAHSPAPGGDEGTPLPRWAPPLVAPHTAAATWEFPAELTAPLGPSPTALG